MGFLLGIDLGGSSIKALALTSEGERLIERHRRFDATAAMEWAKEIRVLVHEMESELGAAAVSVGLSAPGLVAADGASIQTMPGRLQGLEQLNWADYLQRPHPVPVLNDAQAALAGEAWVGAGQGVDNVLLITLGTGVGGAAKVDGRLLRGAIGRAGHVGHICLDPKGTPDICRTPGSLELAVGNCTILDRTEGRFKTTLDLVAAAETGDTQAQQWWQETVHRLACGLVSLENVLDPELILIGGGIARAGAALFDPLADYMNQMEWLVSDHRVMIRPAALGEWAGAYGAALTGYQRVVTGEGASNESSC